MSKILKWGILSTADITNTMIPVIQKNERCEVRAVASRSLERATEHASKHNIPKSYGNYKGMLEDKEIDAVYISLPNSMHREWCIAAARAGKHILCEKPLATVTDEAKEIVDEASKNKVFLQEGFMYRYHPQTLKAKEIVESGVLGELKYLHGVFSFFFAEAYGEKGATNYRMNSAMGGGVLWDMGSYLINYFRYLIDQEPVNVYGYAEKYQGSKVDGLFSGILEFPNKVIAQFECSYFQPQFGSMEIFGKNGHLRIENPFCLPFVEDMPMMLNVSEVEDAITVEKANSYEMEVDHFCKCVLDGATREVPIDDAILNTKTVETLYESAHKRNPIQIG